MRPAKKWVDRVALLAAILEQNPSDVAFAFVDSWLGEHFTATKVLSGLLSSRGGGEKLKEAVNLYRGVWRAATGDEPGHALYRINELLKKKPMPGTRTGIISAIHQRLEDPKSLTGNGVGTELVAYRKIYSRMKLKNGDIGGKRTLALFQQRESRIVTDASIHDLAKSYPKLMDRLVFMTKIHRLVISDLNRAKVRAYIDSFVLDPNFESRLFDNVQGTLPVIQIYGLL